MQRGKLAMSFLGVAGAGLAVHAAASPVAADLVLGQPNVILDETFVLGDREVVEPHHPLAADPNDPLTADWFDGWGNNYEVIQDDGLTDGHGLRHNLDDWNVGSANIGTETSLHDVPGSRLEAKLDVEFHEVGGLGQFRWGIYKGTPVTRERAQERFESGGEVRPYHDPSDHRGYLMRAPLGSAAFEGMEQEGLRITTEDNIDEIFGQGIGGGSGDYRVRHGPTDHVYDVIVGGAGQYSLTLRMERLEDGGVELSYITEGGHLDEAVIASAVVEGDDLRPDGEPFGIPQNDFSHLHFQADLDAEFTIDRAQVINTPIPEPASVGLLGLGGLLMLGRRRVRNRA